MSNSGRLSTNGSGNHDYPAASSASTSRSRDANAESTSNFRQPPYSTLFDNVLPRYRARQSSNRPSANDHPPAPNVVESTLHATHQLRHMSSRPDSRQRMRNVLRSLYDISQELEEVTNSPVSRSDLSTQGSMRPGAPEDSRPRAHPAGRFHRPRQERVEALARSESGLVASNGTNPVPGFHEVGERLAQVNEDARNLLDRPIPHGQLEAMIRDGSEGRHRRKRARLMEKHKREYPVVNYGHYGQVVPGKLTMELVSTDGGVIEPYRYRHSPENLLKDDLSVYCTQSPRCNIVLRHMGGTTFSLDKLVIKAPKRGYTDPVREGLVFVAMKKDELFDRTTRYRIYHLPTSRFASRQSRQDTPDEDPYGTHFEPHRAGLTRTNRSEIHRSVRLPPAPLDSTNAHNYFNFGNYENGVDCSDSSDSEIEATQILPAAEAVNGDGNDEQHQTDDNETGGRSSGRPTVRNGIAYWTRQWNESEGDMRQRRPPTWAQRFRPRRVHSPSSSDYQDMLQQIDFDEVLRRGETTSADRRSRRQAMQARLDGQIEAGQVEASVRAQTASDTADAAIRSNDLLNPVVRFSIQKWCSEDELDHEHEHEHDPDLEREVERDHDGEQDNDHIIDLEHYHEPDMDEASTSSSSSDISSSEGAEINHNGHHDRRHHQRHHHHGHHDQIEDILQGSRNGSGIDTGNNVGRSGSGSGGGGGGGGGAGGGGTNTLDQIRLCTTTSNKITIRFDPPLSAKYILLKLWSPKEGGNIDIERVCAYGFAGVRWFPCVEQR